MNSIGIITVSDRSYQGKREDLSGPAIIKWAQNNNYEVAESSIVPDEKDHIKSILIDFSEKKINLIVTTGGTGMAPRDVTPEATLEIIEKLTPGFGELMRHKSLEITPHAILSRAVAGIRNNSLIVNLPGSPKAAIENLEFIKAALPHAIDLIKDEVNDCGSL